MDKLLAKFTVAFILLYLLWQFIPPRSAYSLRPLSHAERFRIFRLGSGLRSNMIAPDALREVRLTPLSGVAVVDAHAYILDAKLDLTKPLTIDDILLKIEVAASAEAKRHFTKDGRLLTKETWQKKAVATIVLSSLPSLQDLLEETFPELKETITKFITSKTEELTAELRDHNSKIREYRPEISLKDYSLRYLRSPTPIPPSRPTAPADPSVAI